MFWKTFGRSNMGKNRLAIFDLDGTLFDTKDVNFRAYRRATEECGYSFNVDYKFYCDFCNGSNFRAFLPKIISGISPEGMEKIHIIKKKCYSEYLMHARKNRHLFSIIQCMRSEYNIALVTNASRVNTMDILSYFNVTEVFDWIITQEDVHRPKPAPDSFIKAMEISGTDPEDTIIFEDSCEGIEAAKASGADYFQIYGYN